MTISQMQYYKAVCRFSSITKAAENAHISQPAMSTAMKELEQECGVPLFVHKANALSVTDEGIVLLEEIEPVLKQYEHIGQLISNHLLDRKYLRISFSTFSGSKIYPALCSRFHRLHPDLRIISMEGSTSHHFELLDAGQVDLILTAKHPQMTPEEWDASPLYRHYCLETSAMPMAFCVSRDHPLAGAGSVTWKQIAAEQLILLDDSFNLTAGIKRDILASGLTLPPTVQYTSQMYTVERFIEANAACGFLPGEVAAENPRIVPLSYPNKYLRRTYLTYRPDHYLFTAARVFLEMAREMYPQP